MKQDSEPLTKKLRRTIRQQSKRIERLEEQLEFMQQDNRFLRQQLRSAKNYGPTA